jgi:hypothetical protein
MTRDRFGEELEEGAAASSSGTDGTPKKEPLPPIIETVPAGTIGMPCRSPKCGKRIYMVRRPSKAKVKDGMQVKLVNVPIDCDVEGGVRPTARDDGRGVNHFTTCVDATRF